MKARAYAHPTAFPYSALSNPGLSTLSEDLLQPTCRKREKGLSLAPLGRHSVPWPELWNSGPLPVFLYPRPSAAALPLGLPWPFSYPPILLSDVLIYVRDLPAPPWVPSVPMALLDF